MLVCEMCKAALSISFHPNLKAADVRHIASLYQTKLCSAHKVFCSFYSKAFPKSSLTSIVPSYLASVLPEETVDLAEHPAPQSLLQNRVQTLIDKVHSRKIPSLDLPAKSIQEFLREGETPEAFVARISAALGTKEEHKEWAAVLALFGWEPMEKNSCESNERLMMLHCSTCLAQGRLHMQDANDTDIAAPPAKKQRIGEGLLFNPILSHRHYCPFICGFPSEGSFVPMWQTIATNLFRTEESANNDEMGVAGKEEEILMKIHRILKSGIAYSASSYEQSKTYLENG
jgi:hypothetical protein